MAGPHSSDDKPLSFRRGNRKASAPLPEDDKEEAPISEPGIEYLCRRFECKQARSKEPFVLSGAALDDPICPGCGKGDKLEELGVEEESSSKPPWLLFAIIAGALLLLLLGGWGFWAMRPRPHSDNYTPIPRGTPKPDVKPEIPSATPGTTPKPTPSPPVTIDPVVPSGRVLTMDDASIYHQPNKQGGIKQGNLPRFNAYNVIREEKRDGQTWFEVTTTALPDKPLPNWKPEALGWMPEDQVISWKHSLVMTFTTPFKRKPALIFGSESDLDRLARMPADQRKTEMDRIDTEVESAIASKKPLADLTVIAREPLSRQSQEQAYIIPIVDFRDASVDYIPNKFLKIAAGVGVEGSGKKDLPEADVVFVMDTTGSMGPYLDKLLGAVRVFSKELGEANQRIRFGFVGYRDDHHRYPELEYTTRNFTEQPQPIEQFIETLAAVRPVSRPTKDDTPEAVFDGLDEALAHFPWRAGKVHMIILVGDAPAHPRKAPGNRSGQNEGTLRKEAARRGASIFVLHIINSQFSKTGDALATEQFQELSRSNENGPQRGVGTSAYVAVDAKKTDGFGGIVLEKFQQVKGLLEGRIVDTPNQDGFRAMLENAYVNWLAAQNRSEPPKVVQGWASEKVLTEPGRAAMTPMVLLTRNQLNELAARLKELLDTGRNLRQENSGAASFLEMLKQNSGWTLINPGAPILRGSRVQEIFRVPAGIDKLPYKSRVLGISDDEWRAMVGDQQDQLFKDWETMLQHYANLNRNQGAWKPLVRGANAEDHVAGLELDMLP